MKNPFKKQKLTTMTPSDPYGDNIWGNSLKSWDNLEIKYSDLAKKIKEQEEYIRHKEKEIHDWYTTKHIYDKYNPWKEDQRTAIDMIKAAAAEEERKRKEAAERKRQQRLRDMEEFIEADEELRMHFENFLAMKRITEGAEPEEDLFA